MVKERESANMPPFTARPKANQDKYPEFGKTTSSQDSKKVSNVFNIPEPGKARPEHHLPPQSRPTASMASNGLRVDQPKPAMSRGNSEVVVIDRPANYPSLPHRSKPVPTFSSMATPDFIESSHPLGFSAAIPPTGPPAFSYQNLPPKYPPHVSASNDIFDDNYGSFDPGSYMDSGRANENIKALLEGAFEDEDDKPKSRLRSKKPQAGVDALSGKVKALDVGKAKQGETSDQEEEEDDGTVEGLNVKLLPHQIEGVSWMCDKEFGAKKIKGTLPKGGILADDMGLGKTIQSIALILTNTKSVTSGWKDNDKRKIHSDTHHATLVVAPLALIKQWETEIKEKVTPSHALKVHVHHGTQRSQRSSDLKKYDVVVTTYQTLASEHGNSGQGLEVGCFGVRWFRLVLDEAHSIKNRNAKATKACCALKAEYRWCLTGTPMQNNLDELQSLIHFLQIKPYNELSTWRNQITRPMSNGKGGLAIRRLQVILRAFMKRRTKDVLKKEGALTTGSGNAPKSQTDTFQITKREIEKIEAEFSSMEREYYQRFEDRANRSLKQMARRDELNYANALVLLLRLRQACNSPALVARSLSKDKDALDTGKSSGKQTPKMSQKAEDDDVDNVANMLDGLSVINKKCDACQAELTKEEKASGAIRCEECESDLQAQTTKSKKNNAKKSKSSKKKTTRRRQNRRRVIKDSDDEDEEGKGEWLGSEDSNTDEDEEVKSKARTKKAINVESSDEDENDEDNSHEDSQEDIFADSRVKEMVESTKIRALVDILNRESGEYKFIVFSQFTTMLDLIEPFLNKHGLNFTRYDGGMRNDQREASLHRLRTSPRTRILLCSLRCGSLGLNLTAASRVVIMEPFWNPFVEEQAIDRVHRLNQTLDVVVYKMTIKDTVEERILALQERKRELANQTIEGGKAGAGKLSLQDLLALFRSDDGHEHVHHTVAGNRGAKALTDSYDYGATTRIMPDGNRDSSGSGDSSSRGRREFSGGRKEDAVYGRRW